MGSTSRVRTAALAAAVAGTLIAGVTSAGIQPALAASSTAKGGTKPSATVTVTLVTGDRVVVGSDGGVRQVVRGKGREGTVFSVRREAGHTYVVPQDALRLIGDGVLDRRLFDVAQLVEYGYDDAHRTALPLIVGYGPAGGGGGAGASALKATGDPLAGVARDDRRPLPAVGGEAFAAPKAGVTALWSAVTAGANSARTAGAAPAAPSPTCGWTARSAPPSTRACRRSAHPPCGRRATPARASRWRSWTRGSTRPTRTSRASRPPRRTSPSPIPWTSSGTARTWPPPSPGRARSRGPLQGRGARSTAP